MTRPHLEDERLINERIFGRCNHNSWHPFTDRFDHELLVCDQCGEEFIFKDRQSFHDKLKQNLTPADFMKRQVRTYSVGEVLPSVVLRQVEAGGWSVMVRSTSGSFVCELQKGTLAFSSGPHSEKNAAIVQAAALLAKSGKFRVPE